MTVIFLFFSLSAVLDSCLVSSSYSDKTIEPKKKQNPPSKLQENLSFPPPKIPSLSKVCKKKKTHVLFFTLHSVLMTEKKYCKRIRIILSEA